MTTTTIPFFPYADLFTKDEQALTEVMVGVCSRGAFILQQDCLDFEAELATYVGVRHALGVANGTDALIIALKAVGVGPGDEVILPSHTYVASAAAVHMVGATPVPAECGPDHMLDAEDVERRITPRTKAIMPVQINGRTCDMDALQAIAAARGLLIVEDAAQGLGSRYRDRYAGTFGAFGTLSFYPAKLLGCFGDGGAILTNDDAVAERIRLLRDHGRNAEGAVVDWGYNSRLDNLHAAVLSHRFKTYPSEVERRRQVAAMYQAGLGDLAEVALPPAPASDPRHFDVYQNYEIEVDRRDELRQYLDNNGVKTIIQWAGTPVHQFKELGFTVSLPKTDRFFTRCLMLPMNAVISDEQVERVVRVLRRFYAR
jgi:dTDP-4-amino-4,6-dideoxygalactose transaminase